MREPQSSRNSSQSLSHTLLTQYPARPSVNDKLRRHDLRTKRSAKATRLVRQCAVAESSESNRTRRGTALYRALPVVHWASCSAASAALSF